MALKLSELTITSPAFADRQPIPVKHTADGEDISPPLEWTNVPEGTSQFVLLCHDPDAPFITPEQYGFVHWLVYNIPASTTNLPEGGAEQFPHGQNDFGVTAYRGPACPPGHGPHHYYFTLLALDRELDLEPGLTLPQLLERVQPHVLGMNRLIGSYERHG